MTGCVYLRGDVYYIRIKYTDPTGKLKEKWISTGLRGRGAKRQAQLMIDDILMKHAYLEGSKLSERSMLFTDYLKWWQLSQENKVEKSTYESYITYFDVHIIPYFEPMKMMIQDIKPIHIHQMMEYKLTQGRADGKPGGLSREMVKKIVGLTRRVLDTAVLLGDIPTNPAARIQLPREKEKGNREEKIVYLTESEAQEVINAFSGEPLEAMVYITLYYGLRRSEILGLQWSAIDFEKDTMAIRHVVVKSRTVEAKDTTKSYNSRRSFKLLPEVKELLLNLKHEQEMLREFYGNTYIENDYVFKYDNGKPYLPDYVTRKFQKVLAAHGLRKMRFHDLRHTTASVLFDKGWDVNEIREWLGHADIETTANIYTHLSHVKAIALAKNMENTFTLAK